MKRAGTALAVSASLLSGAACSTSNERSRSTPIAIENEASATTNKSETSTTVDVPISRNNPVVKRLNDDLNRQERDIESQVMQGHIRVKTLIGACALVLNKNSNHVWIIPNPGLIGAKDEATGQEVTEVLAYSVGDNGVVYGGPSALVSSTNSVFHSQPIESDTVVSMLARPTVEPRIVEASGGKGHTFKDDKTGQLVLSVGGDSILREGESLEKFASGSIAGLICEAGWYSGESSEKIQVT